ncbi:MAG TPA: hypothetical protein PK431_03780 [Chitinophagales bacterium]|nr:hypothetical protein [Chitinophagales bacterium]
MKVFFKKYFFILAIGIGWIFSGCSAGNKVIPDLFDITKIDSSNDILSFFNVYGLGDTSFNMEVNSLDSIAADFKNTVKDDSIKIIGIQTNGSSNSIGGIFITTYSMLPGVYSIDTTAGNTAMAGVALIKIPSRNIVYIMNKGYVRISEIDATNKTIKGDFDVNNNGNISGKKFRMKAYFYMKYI